MAIFSQRNSAKSNIKNNHFRFIIFMTLTKWAFHLLALVALAWSRGFELPQNLFAQLTNLQVIINLVLFLDVFVTFFKKNFRENQLCSVC